MTMARVYHLGLLIVAGLFAIVSMAPMLSAQSAKSSLKDPAQATLFNDISDRLVCQCGCNMILRVCNHYQCPSAVPMRAKIEEQILAGRGEEAIVERFVEEYGMVVLSSPPPKGINLAAWVMPGFAVLLGLFLVFYLVSSWLSKKRIQPVSTTGALDPSMKSRIEEELKGLDT